MIGLDVPGGIEVKKTNGSRDCIGCHYWYFLEINFRFKPKVCNGHHDSTEKAMSFNDAAIVSDKGNGYRIHFWYMSKDEAVYFF